MVDKKVMKIPYGIADFYLIRTRGQLYVDRTDRIATVEVLGHSLRHERIGNELRGYLNTMIRVFQRDYREHQGHSLRTRVSVFESDVRGRPSTVSAMRKPAWTYPCHPGSRAQRAELSRSVAYRRVGRARPLTITGGDRR